MGIDLYCGDKNFGCSYSCWHNIRIELIKATFEYEEETHERALNIVKWLEFLNKIDLKFI
jgi:hypothetical protein